MEAGDQEGQAGLREALSQTSRKEGRMRERERGGKGKGSKEREKQKAKQKSPYLGRLP